MSEYQVAFSLRPARSALALALVAPLLIGTVIAFSSTAESTSPEPAARPGPSLSGLRSTQIRRMDFAALPESAFGDRE